MKQVLVFSCIGALAAMVAVGIAQGTSNGQSSTSGSKQTQTSTSKSSSGQASSSASGSASANGSASSGGQFGGSSSGFGTGSGSSQAMAIPTHVIIYSPAGEAEVSEAVAKEQSLFIDRNLKLGYVVMSGPWRDERGGMTLLRVKDDMTAEALAEKSPIVREGFFNAEVRAWKVDQYLYASRPPMPGTATSRP